MEAQGLLVIWGSVDPTTVDEGALNDWWTNEHLPERLRLPGFQRARRYRALNPENGHNEYLAVYQLSNVQDLASAEYLHALNHPTQKTMQFMPSLAQMSRFACEIVSSESASVLTSNQPVETHNMLYMVVYEVDVAQQDHNPLLSIQEHIGRARDAALAKTMHVHLAKGNQELTEIGSASKSYEGVHFKSSQVVGETETLAADTVIALYELSHNPTDSSIAEGDIVSKHLGDTSSLRGVRIRHTNIYRRIASLDRSSLAH
ncbi:hypothetical protein COCMIDRAFT_105717 [Bipolaris oryzae ATCC 44560]|uniref:ABM domain-containing protein n=1 Tax=Bipolaris oryzae ATCC 44560 TaxID=930090 RepID=W6YVL9_COCMI|nr:uncharacterized protein COCMIDRAFT_105717 [Bipolaris oryzae ATCC 44560]EUC41600.1 hypothetical protein COCMIDRAFT_105717 [Bipolaris oryzae ATCC 44560]